MLIDLHRHLEGAVRVSTILDLARRHGVALPAATEAALTRHVCVTEPVPGLAAFLTRFRWIGAVMVDEHACRRMAVEAVLDAAAEGIGHLELRFSPLFMAQRDELAADAIVDAVIDGARSGAEQAGIEVSLIGILSRTFGPERAWRELELLERRREAFVGLDLAGDEARWPGELFVDHFRRGRDRGWRITVHAGECRGPDSVWQAIRELGAERIGHAVSAVQDPALMAYMATSGITVEANLTSNVQTGAVASYESHPLRNFVEQGVPVTVNTDDPAISGIDLPMELELAASACGLDENQIDYLHACARKARWLAS